MGVNMRSTTGIFTFYSIFLIGVLILVPISAAQDSSAATESPNLTVEQILDRVESKFTNTKFSADFMQQSIIKAMDITDMASGKVFVKYPGMMRWEYKNPDRQIIITDAKELWIYRPEHNQVMTGSAPTFFRDGKGASFLSNIRLIRQKFDISLEQGESELFYHLKLIPREKTLDISEIRLMVSKQTYNVLRILTLNFYGDETRIDLINFSFDQDLDDSLFSFRIPEGVDVLRIDE
jgi:outer membrane lipoprotein carrier protein